MRNYRHIIAAFGLALGLVTFGLTPAQEGAEQPSVNYAHEHFQPAYAEGGLVQFEQQGPAPETVAEENIRFLYEVEYPAGWEEVLARPICNYCDHFGDGENAWDYHDHVLASLPSTAQNQAGVVHWHVLHVRPTSTGDASQDAEIAAAYADRLPVTSSQTVRELLDSTLADGTPLAEVVDTEYVFTAPLSRR